MQQYNKTKGIRGIVGLYNKAIRFRYMITPKAEDCLRILIFWKKHGDMAAKEAFNVLKPTLFRWQKDLPYNLGAASLAIFPNNFAPSLPAIEDLKMSGIMIWRMRSAFVVSLLTRTILGKEAQTRIQTGLYADFSPRKQIFEK